MNTSQTAPGPVYPAGYHAQANRIANPPGFDPGSLNTFDRERDARLVESLLTLVEFVGNAKERVFIGNGVLLDGVVGAGRDGGVGQGQAHDTARAG